jgi:hypothetical protein
VHKNLLNNNDVFLFDTGAELFVWVGKGASQQEKARCVSLHGTQDTHTLPHTHTDTTYKC